ncbi:hypothetical protein AtEden1_Chr2g0233011 [Arabidopsis thaliana]
MVIFFVVHSMLMDLSLSIAALIIVLEFTRFSYDNIVTCSSDGSAIIWIPRSRSSPVTSDFDKITMTFNMFS